VPFVKISRKLVPNSTEKEYVFLPGTITSVSSSIYSEYKTDINLIKMYREIPITIKGGGEGNTDDMFGDLNIDLRNRLIVWYRVIYNRPAEIIAVSRLPKTMKKIKADWKEQVEDNDVKYEDATQLIPEYKDLVKKNKDNVNQSLDEEIKTSRKIASFNIYTAIVERGTINILTIHYGIPRSFFTELFDMKKAEDVKAVIFKCLKGNPWY
jgi:hypothetical protein